MWQVLAGMALMLEIVAPLDSGAAQIRPEISAAFPKTVDAFGQHYKLLTGEVLRRFVVKHTITIAVGHTIFYGPNGIYHFHGEFSSKQGRYVVRTDAVCSPYPKHRTEKKWYCVAFYRSATDDVVSIDDGALHRVRRSPSYD